MRQPPLVSVVIPCFNAEATVAEAIESVLSQEVPPREIIAVDDGSTDGTPRLLERYRNRIRIIRIANSGHAAARATGNRAARGKYVAWLDADDVAHPDRLRRQVETLEGHPEAVLVSTDFDPIGPEASRLHGGVRRLYGLEGPRSIEAIYGPSDSQQVAVAGVFDELLFGNFVHPPTVMLRRETYDQTAPAPSGLPIAEDWLCFVELARTGPFAFIDAALIGYRVADGQMSSPSRGVRMGLEVLAAKELVISRNSSLFAQQDARRRRFLAATHFGLADEFVDVDRRRSLSHLWRGVQLAGTNVRVARILAKVLMPPALLSAARRARHARSQV